jgi:hypothetical protein
MRFIQLFDILLLRIFAIGTKLPFRFEKCMQSGQKPVEYFAVGLLSQ